MMVSKEGPEWSGPDTRIFSLRRGVVNLSPFWIIAIGKGILI
jgi:hypothetical protein